MTICLAILLFIFLNLERENALKIFNFFNKIKNRFYSAFEKKNQIQIKQENQSLSDRKNTTSPDFIDYDGMGNQGRFPSRGKR